MFLTEAANRGSVSTGYDIDNSCKFEADNSEVMTHTYDSAPTSQKKMTISMWYKRTEVGSNIGLIEFGNDASGDYFQIRWGRDVYGSLETYGMRFGSTNFSVGNTYGAVRDTSAWYHIVVAIDTTQGTAANRFKVYRNGAELGWSTDNRATITQNQDLALGENGKRVVIGEGAYKYNGYIAEVNYVDGQQLSSTDFGEYDEDSGIWIPKAYTGTYGNNGFYLDFSNVSDLGEDQSGNNHDFSLTNISAANKSTDTPTNNFCTYNNNFRTASTIAATEGQTKVTAASGSGWVSIVATFGLTSGKWYWEAASSGHYVFYGIADVESDTIPQKTGGYFLGYGDDNSTKAIGMYGLNGQVYSDTAGHNGPGAAANTVVQIALDMDNRCIYFGANGSYISGADPTSGASKTNASQWNANWSDTVYPALSVSATYHTTANFGGYTTDVISSPQSDANGYGAFEYAPPSGYYAICTKNLAEYG